MKAIICDRPGCGQIVRGATTHGTLTTDLLGTPAAEVETLTLDLCGGCSGDLRRWWRRPATGEVEA